MRPKVAIRPVDDNGRSADDGWGLAVLSLLTLVIIFATMYACVNHRREQLESMQRLVNHGWEVHVRRLAGGDYAVRLERHGVELEDAPYVVDSDPVQALRVAEHESLRFP